MDIKLENSGPQRHMSSDVQTYLIDNYREAVKQGDRSAAKSCLLAARYFSVDDPIVMNEIYLMAKSDGDVSEASKCFASLIKLLLLGDVSEGDQADKGTSSETAALISRIKDEIGFYLNQIKSKSLHLKSKSRPNLVSARSTVSTGNRIQSDISCINIQFNGGLTAMSQSEITFYQQLFDNLPTDVNRSIIDYTIESCQDDFEQCRLMLLSMSVFPDSVEVYGNRSITKLIGIVKSQTSQEEAESREYASSLLVLDVIPLVLQLTSLSNLSIEVKELFFSVLDYYSAHCLTAAAKEHDFNQLNDALKKSIADRILCKESSDPEEGVIEEEINSTFDLLYEKYRDELTTSGLKDLLIEVKDVIAQEPSVLEDRLGSLVDSKIIDSNNPEQNARQRARRCGTKHPTNDLKLVSPTTVNRVVFCAIVRQIFKSCAVYLRQTRTRIVIDFYNPLLDSDDNPFNEHPLSQYRGRVKPTSESSESATLRGRRVYSTLGEVGQPSGTSPLNSQYSRQMDDKIISNICVAKQCLDVILTRSTLKSFWEDFLTHTSIATQNWYRRVIVDTSLFKNQHDEVCKVLSDLVLGSDNPESQNNTGSHPDVAVLRALAQFICCEVVLDGGNKLLFYIGSLLSKLRQCGLAAARDNYAVGEVMDEYKILVCQEFGFLFFDVLPLVRYCVDILTFMLDSLMARDVFQPDPLVGHIIVLSQFDWPKNARLYEKCIEWIRNNKPKSTTPQCLSSATKFTYPEFFQYVKNPSFIEDFMALLNQGYTLDFKDSTSVTMQSTMSQQSTSRSSSATPTRASKAITTRGVNKSFKEDLKVALTAQMKNSTTFVPLDKVIEFIQAFLLPYLEKLT